MKKDRKPYDLRNRPIGQQTDSEIRGRLATMLKRQLELQDEINKIDRMRDALQEELRSR